MSVPVDCSRYIKASMNGRFTILIIRHLPIEVEDSDIDPGMIRTLTRLSTYVDHQVIRPLHET